MARGGVAFRGATLRNYELTGPGTAGHVLTSNGPGADPTFQASGGMSSASITLTNAQIKALPTTYQTVVAAPGADLLLMPVAAAVYIDATAGAYTNIDTSPADAEGLTIAYGDWDEDAMTYFAMSGAAEAFLGLLAGPYIRTPTPASLASLTTFTLRRTAANFLNQPLKLVAWNDTGDYTGGHASNTGTVIVYYQTMDFS